MLLSELHHFPVVRIPLLLPSNSSILPLHLPPLLPSLTCTEVRGNHNNKQGGERAFENFSSSWMNCTTFGIQISIYNGFLTGVCCWVMCKPFNQNWKLRWYVGRCNPLGSNPHLFQNYSFKIVIEIIINEHLPKAILKNTSFSGKLSI